MNKDQAYSILNQTLSKLSTTREGHQTLQNALDLLAGKPVQQAPRQNKGKSNFIPEKK